MPVAMTTPTATKETDRLSCPKCASLRVRDMRRVPKLMGVWVGLLAVIATLPFTRHVVPETHMWLMFVACLPVAALGGYIFCRLATTYAAQYECRDCHNRWRDPA